MAKKFVGIKISEEEFQNLLELKDVMGYHTITDVIRSLIRFARVFFDPKLTIQLALKPYVFNLLGDQNFIKHTPIADIIKPIPILEKILRREEP